MSDPGVHPKYDMWLPEEAHRRTKVHSVPNSKFQFYRFCRGETERERGFDKAAGAAFLMPTMRLTNQLQYPIEGFVRGVTQRSGCSMSAVPGPATR